MFKHKKLSSNLVKMLLVTVFFVGCKEHLRVYEYKQTIVNSKIIIQIEGSDRFILSFTDGESEYCSFGEYTKYKIGDTLCWKRECGCSWFVENCH